MTRSTSAAEKPGGIQAADHRAHAGAGDGVDGNVVFLEHLEHADVRGAARAAAREHEPDARPTGVALATARPARATNLRARGRTRQTVLFFLLSYSSVGVARIVVRSDNRSTNHAHLPHPVGVAAARRHCRRDRRPAGDEIISPASTS